MIQQEQGHNQSQETELIADAKHPDGDPVDGDPKEDENGAAKPRIVEKLSEVACHPCYPSTCVLDSIHHERVSADEDTIVLDGVQVITIHHWQQQKCCSDEGEQIDVFEILQNVFIERTLL
jgi:hypothetical protein